MKMKKWIVFAAAVLLAAGTLSAQTPQEKQASADRIAVLKQPAPNNCGIQKIDDAIGKCKSLAEGTVAIADMTAALNGEGEGFDPVAAADRIKKASTDLSDAARVLGEAAAALKEVRNPMKLKSAKKALDYAQSVVTAAGEELPYQGKVVAALVSE